MFPPRETSRVQAAVAHRWKTMYITVSSTRWELWRDKTVQAFWWRRFNDEQKWSPRLFSVNLITFYPPERQLLADLHAVIALETWLSKFAPFQTSTGLWQICRTSDGSQLLIGAAERSTVIRLKGSGNPLSCFQVWNKIKRSDSHVNTTTNITEDNSETWTRGNNITNKVGQCTL